jgi:restriction endonuclease Mrr
MAAVSDGETHKFRDVINRLRHEFDMAPKVLQQKNSSGKQKGVFITTSKFSSDEREFVGMIDKTSPGAQLAMLMVDHGFGLSTKQAYEFKQLDTDYFNED